MYKIPIKIVFGDRLLLDNIVPKNPKEALLPLRLEGFCGAADSTFTPNC
jgi:hypothetical protein